MIKIDGHRLDEYDMVVLTDHQNPILPAIQDKTVKIPGVPGLYDFGSEISPKYFDIPIGIKPQQDYASIRQKVEQFKKIILDEYGHPKEFELIFDYFPERYYKAKVNSMGISLERLITMGRFNLPLVAYDPYAYSVVKSDEITWGSEVITFEAHYTFGHEGSASTVTVTEPTNLNYYVDGNALKPIIEISGSADGLTVSTSGKSFSLPDFTNSNWVIEGDRYLVEKNGTNAYSQYNGEFLEFFPGSNTVTVTGSNIDITLRIYFRDKYL